MYVSMDGAVRFLPAFSVRPGPCTAKSATSSASLPRKHRKRGNAPEAHQRISCAALRIVDVLASGANS